jgi:DNA invertase Pin-like site-specific DNA recombinase
MDNVMDMIRKGRKAKVRICGEDSAMSKLTDDQVEQIRSQAENMSGVEIASVYGVSRAQVSRIINRKSRWVE